MAIKMDSVKPNSARTILHWASVIALWLAIYVGAIATVAVCLMFFMVYQGSVSNHPFDSWHMYIAILIVLALFTAVLRAVWPRIVFTEEKFIDAARESGAVLSSVGRVQIAGFGAVEAGYYFHRGFVSFPVDWKPPAFHPKRKWMKQELECNDGWIKAWHLWSLMKLMMPLVIRLPAGAIGKDEVERARRTLEAALGGRKVEVWLQRYHDGGVWVGHLTTEKTCEAGPSDDVFLFGYAAPWESDRIRAGIGVAAQLGEQYPHERLRGKGWFVG